jgi:hypothetical protein
MSNSTSKELIEQLANKIEETVAHDISQIAFSLTAEQLEAFAKAYQAAAPIDNVREVLEKAAVIALNGCLVPPDGGSPTENEIAMCDYIAKAIRALIPSTQAPKDK